MVPATAINFLLLGCALFLTGFGRTILTAQLLVLLTGRMGTSKNSFHATQKRGICR